MNSILCQLHFKGSFSLKLNTTDIHMIILMIGEMIYFKLVHVDIFRSPQRVQQFTCRWRPLLQRYRRAEYPAELCIRCSSREGRASRRTRSSLCRPSSAWWTPGPPLGWVLRIRKREATCCLPASSWVLSSWRPVVRALPAVSLVQWAFRFEV